MSAAVVSFVSRPDQGPGVLDTEPRRTARQRLDAALLGMAVRRERPRCAEYGGAELWTSDDDEDRAQARRWCAGCPVIVACLESAIEENERWAVRGGTDFRNPHTRRAADRQRTNRKATP